MHTQISTSSKSGSSTLKLELSYSSENKKTCGLSKTGPYKLELICERPGSWAKEILNIFLFSKLQNIQIAKMKTRKNLKPNHSCQN